MIITIFKDVELLSFVICLRCISAPVTILPISIQYLSIHAIKSICAAVLSNLSIVHSDLPKILEINSLLIRMIWTNLYEIVEYIDQFISMFILQRKFFKSLKKSLFLMISHFSIQKSPVYAVVLYLCFTFECN